MKKTTKNIKSDCQGHTQLKSNESFNTFNDTYLVTAIAFFLNAK